MINTPVQLIVIMPYNHSYDRQLLIPASFECFSLSELHQVDGANAPAMSMCPPQPPIACTHSRVFSHVTTSSLFCPPLCYCPTLHHDSSQPPPFSFSGLRTPPPAPLLLRGTELWLCLNRWCFRLDRHVKRRFKSQIFMALKKRTVSCRVTQLLYPRREWKYQGCEQ